MHESIIKQELIREVTMGPFKHKIDDGLEVRKVGTHSPHTFLHIMKLILNRALTRHFTP